MKNLSTREKLLLAILLIAGIGYVYYTFFLQPVMNKISETKVSIAAYETQLQEIQQAIADKDKHDLEYGKTKEKAKDYLVKMPYHPRDPQLVYDFKGVAGKAGILINNISLLDQASDTQAQDPDLSSVPVSINFSAASYVNAVRFVNGLEAAPRLIQISSVSITKGADTSPIQGSITGDYYYLKTTIPQQADYSFNKGNYGKTDMFK